MAQASGQQAGQASTFAQQQQPQQQSQQAPAQQLQISSVSSAQAGASTITSMLDQEAKYPALDNYISRKVQDMLG